MKKNESVGIVVDEGLLKQIKTLYVNSGFNKDQMEVEKNAIVKALKKIGANNKSKIDRHFQLAIEESDNEMKCQMCTVR